MEKILLFFVVFVIFVSEPAAQTTESQIFDKFGSISCDDLRFRLNTFMDELLKSKESRGYVIVYEGIYSDNKLPLSGNTTLFSQYMIQQFQAKKFPSDKYLLVSGGIQEKYSVELWIVPKYSKPQISKSSAEKIKYRKGRLRNLESVCNGG